MKAFFVKAMKGEAHFVYMCMDVFKELSVQFSLADFECEMLCLMNIAHVQLHLNSWAFLCTFQILCKRLSIEPTVNLCISINWKWV